MPYHVYAIHLDRDAMGERPPRVFRDRNEHIDWDYPLHDGCEFYYVGQTAHTPECRFKQHKQCYGRNIDFHCICRIKSHITGPRSNRYARRYGLFLANSVFAHHNPIRTRRQSEALEKQLCDELRELGHCVWWG